ncbi:MULTISPECIES: FUSC family protein [Gordonia]|uniref:Integral membrane bound transporter domain-containing protein n=1 Tax=Gordonia sihwensis NBRC 108236 TaxID=1223544 RepID=L7LPZ7_9ACTN|nr:MULTISPECIES: FUSC family protein [Gordonia]AUH69684.1 FUSC family protein [Gordonia sp. YC-JH1]GAC62128.1 hypothetical protein GSI01S_29_00160 [Gordonia sihwensis NBRC 108236]
MNENGPVRSPALRRVTRGLLGLFAVQHIPGAIRPALVKAAITATTVLICCALFGPELGIFGMLGAFVTFWETDRPLWPRVRNTLLVTALIVGSMSFGVAIAPHRWAFVPAAVLIVVVFSMLYNTFMLGRGPSPVLPMYAGIVGAFFGVDQHLGWSLVGLTALAGTITAALLTVPLLFEPHGPEERAVARAKAAVAAYVGLPDDVPDEMRRQIRNTAFAACDSALVTLRSAWPATRNARHHELADTLYEAQSALYSQMLTRLGEDPTLRDDVPRAALVERRPATAYLAYHALHWTSVEWFTSWRMGFVAALGGLVALSTGAGHPYWAILTGVIILNQWSHRATSIRRAGQRTVGTMIGVGATYLLSLLHPNEWWSIVIVLACMTGMNALLALNYAIALIFITPMALVMVESVTGAGAELVSADRFLDTIVGALAALAVTWLTSYRFPRKLALTQSRRTARAIDAVDAVNRAGRAFEPDGHRARVALHYELSQQLAVVERAVNDDPQLADLRASEHALSERGYRALARSWQPTV